MTSPSLAAATRAERRPVGDVSLSWTREGRGGCRRGVGREYSSVLKDRGIVQLPPV